MNRVCYRGGVNQNISQMDYLSLCFWKEGGRIIAHPSHLLLEYTPFLLFFSAIFSGGSRARGLLSHLNYVVQPTQWDNSKVVLNHMTQPVEK